MKLNLHHDSFYMVLDHDTWYNNEKKSCGIILNFDQNIFSTNI
jgi:hypothetical protein